MPPFSPLFTTPIGGDHIKDLTEVVSICFKMCDHKYSPFITRCQSKQDNWLHWIYQNSSIVLRFTNNNMSDSTSFICRCLLFVSLESDGYETKTRQNVPVSRLVLSHYFDAKNRCCFKELLLWLLVYLLQHSCDRDLTETEKKNDGVSDSGSQHKYSLFFLRPCCLFMFSYNSKLQKQYWK